jgi:hypothetical protein
MRSPCSVSMCVCPPYSCWTTAQKTRSRGNEYTRSNIRIIGGVAFYEVCIVSEESRWLSLPRTSCLFVFHLTILLVILTLGFQMIRCRAINLEGCEWKQQWPNLRYCPRICLGEVGETTKYISVRAARVPTNIRAGHRMARLELNCSVFVSV